MYDIYTDPMYQGYGSGPPVGVPAYGYPGSTTPSVPGVTESTVVPAVATPTAPAVPSGEFDPFNREFNKGRAEVFGLPAYKKALEAGYTPEQIKAALLESGVKIAPGLNIELGNPNGWDEEKMAKAAQVAEQWKTKKSERQASRELSGKGQGRLAELIGTM